MHLPAYLASRSLLAPLVAAVALTGCSYRSTYVPPRDGRARLVWTDTGVGPSLRKYSKECAERIDEVASERISAWIEPEEWEPGEPRTDTGSSSNGSVRAGSRWGTHHHGGRGIHGGHVGSAGRGAGSVRGLGGGRGLGGARLGGGRGGGFHLGGGGGGGGKGYVALIVLAYFILPTVSIVWATDRPESTSTAYDMDTVHAYNDLVRAGDEACPGAP